MPCSRGHGPQGYGLAFPIRGVVLARVRRRSSRTGSSSGDIVRERGHVCAGPLLGGARVACTVGCRGGFVFEGVAPAVRAQAVSEAKYVSM